MNIFSACLLFDHNTIFDVGGEEEFADEHLFGISEGLKGQKNCFSFIFFAFLPFDRIHMVDVGGADEEEFADEHLFGISEGLKGTEKLFFFISSF